MSKICSRCKLNKNLDCFYDKKTGILGKESMCKECRIKKYAEKSKEYSKTYVRKNPRIVYISTKTHPNGQIICKRCNISKELNKFYFDKSIQNYQEICKDCRSKKHKENLDANRDEINKKRRNALKNNPQLRIRNAFSARLYCLIKQKIKYSNLLSKYLGCSFDEYLKWIQYQFEENMTFDNYGSEWHIDHVKPCASYDLTNENELIECMNWKNLRPCWKEENLTKSNKIFLHTIEQHKNKVESYIKNKTELVV